MNKFASYVNGVCLAGVIMHHSNLCPPLSFAEMRTVCAVFWSVFTFCILTVLLPAFLTIKQCNLCRDFPLFFFPLQSSLARQGLCTESQTEEMWGSNSTVKPAGLSILELWLRYVLIGELGQNKILQGIAVSSACCVRTQCISNKCQRNILL